MVNVKCKSDCAVVPVNGVIEEEMMLQLVSAIQQLHNDYFYTHIELEVCSPCGQAMALDYCVEAMDSLRARGVRFTTRALMSVSSAAANLVSLGDVREASRGASFLYHQARTGRSETVTAQSARQILTAVDKIDERYLARLVGRARRCERRRPALNVSDFNDEDWPIIEYLLIDAGVVQPRPGSAKLLCGTLLKRLRKHVTACLRQDDERPLGRLYRRLLELDRYISAALALELRLLDVLTRCAHTAEPLASLSHQTITWTFPNGQLAVSSPHGQVSPAPVCAGIPWYWARRARARPSQGSCPWWAAVMAPDNRTVGCALIIDPKREIKAHVMQTAAIIPTVSQSTRSRWSSRQADDRS